MHGEGTRQNTQATIADHPVRNQGELLLWHGASHNRPLAPSDAVAGDNFRIRASSSIFLYATYPRPRLSSSMGLFDEVPVGVPSRMSGKRKSNDQTDKKGHETHRYDGDQDNPPKEHGKKIEAYRTPAGLNGVE